MVVPVDAQHERVEVERLKDEPAYDLHDRWPF
jgi:hypothetical protein